MDYLDLLKNNKLSHHAYLLKGDKESILPKLFRFLEENLNIKIRGNPDFWHKGFEIFTIDDARQLKELQGQKEKKSLEDMSDEDFLKEKGLSEDEIEEMTEEEMKIERLKIEKQELAKQLEERNKNIETKEPEKEPEVEIKEEKNTEITSPTEGEPADAKKQSDSIVDEIVNSDDVDPDAN